MDCRGRGQQGGIIPRFLAEVTEVYCLLKWGIQNKEQVLEHGERKSVRILDYLELKVPKDIQVWIVVYMGLQLRRKTWTEEKEGQREF